MVLRAEAAAGEVGSLVRHVACEVEFGSRGVGVGIGCSVCCVDPHANPRPETVFRHFCEQVASDIFSLGDSVILLSAEVAIKRKHQP